MTLRATLDAQIFRPRWVAISPGDRQYLYVAAQLCDDHGMVTGTAIATALGRAPEHVTRTRDRLINQHHVFQPVERGVMQFSVPGFADWVVGHVDRSAPRSPTRRHRSSTRPADQSMTADHDDNVLHGPAPASMRPAVAANGLTSTTVEVVPSAANRSE